MKKILIFTLLLCGVSSFAIDWRVGVGGSYSLYAAKGEKDVKDIGGYLTLAARESTEKLLFSTGFDIHYGKSKQDSAKTNFALGNYHLKAGFTPFSGSVKPFINLVYSWDWLLRDGAINGSNLETGLHMIGAEVQAIIKGNKSSIEYGAGYHYVFHGYHYLDKVRSSIDDYSYAINAFVGYTYELSEKLAYFVNAKAKGYFLAQSDSNTPTFSRPKTEHIIAMLEVGLQF